jgi:S1-C subfamily serine protease
VLLANGERVTATLAGRDPGSDLAILRTEASAGQTAEVAPAGAARAGNLALAVGRAGGAAPSVSFGIISAVGGSWRTMRGGMLDGYLRADLTLYPGFSGGPLVDPSGRVLGINSSHLAGGQAVAIPGNVVSQIVQTLLSHGRVRRGYLGVTSRTVEIPASLREKTGLSQQSGLLLLGVETGSGAESGGLFIGDVLLAIGGQTTADVEDLQAALSGDAVGKQAAVKILRGGELKELSVTPGERE